MPNEWATVIDLLRVLSVSPSEFLLIEGLPSSFSTKWCKRCLQRVLGRYFKHPSERGLGASERQTLGEFARRWRLHWLFGAMPALKC